MLHQIKIDYPETLPDVLQKTQAEFKAEAKMAMAVKLYEMGRLTSGQAASLAGIPRITFLLSCEKFGVSSVIWDEDEIKAEFQE